MRVYKFLSAEFGMKSLHEKRLKVSLVDDLNDPFDLLPYDVRKRDVRSNFRSLVSDFSRMYGMVCFSTSWHDPVMWAHYSDKHKGLCLGFDIPNAKPSATVPDEVVKRLTIKPRSLHRVAI